MFHLWRILINYFLTHCHLIFIIKRHNNAGKTLLHRCSKSRMTHAGSGKTEGTEHYSNRRPTGEAVRRELADKLKYTATENRRIFRARRARKREKITHHRAKRPKSYTNNKNPCLHIKTTFLLVLFYLHFYWRGLDESFRKVVTTEGKC